MAALGLVHRPGVSGVGCNELSSTASPPQCRRHARPLAWGVEWLSGSPQAVEFVESHRAHVGGRKCPHDPWSEDVRYSEIVGNVEAFFASSDGPGSSPLFESLARRMVFNLQDSGIQSSPDPAQEVYKHMKQFDPFANKGCKVNTNRFMSILRSAEPLVEEWAFRCFACLLACLEQDYIKNSSVPKLRPRPDDPAAKTTSSVRSSSFEAAVSRSCSNQLVLGTLMLAEETNEINHRYILVVMKPLLRWFERQSVDLRSVENSKRWLSEQVRGGSMGSLAEVAGTLCDEGSVRWVGFKSPALISRSGAPTESNLVDIAEQDMLAANMAELCLNTIACRLQRCMFMLRGWGPARPLGWMRLCMSCARICERSARRRSGMTRSGTTPRAS